MKRKDFLQSIPSNYNPYLHLFLPSSVVLLGIILSLVFLPTPAGIAYLAIPVAIIGILGFEWAVHRYILHRPQRGLRQLFFKHEVLHHGLYPAADMALRDKRELYLILMPPYAILLIIFFLLPILFLLYLFSPAVAGLVFITSLTSFLFYEVLHLVYHLPTCWLTEWRPIRWLSRLHRFHHAPGQMHSSNFNVTIPLFDWLLGTFHRP